MRSAIVTHFVEMAALASAAAVIGLCEPNTARAEMTIEMQADRAEVALDGQVTVQIRVTSDSLRGAEIELPDFEGFTVARQSVQRPMQFSFGLGGQQRVQSTTHYTFVLRPERPGRIVIPPALVNDGKRRLESRALTIMVTGSGGARPRDQPPAQPPPNDTGPEPTPEPAEGSVKTLPGNAVDAKEVDREAFLRTVVDKRAPYEREQVTVTIYLYTRERLHEAPSVDAEATTDGFWTQDLQQSSTLEQLPAEQIGRARFRVYVMRRFAAFPLHAGELRIGPMALTIRRPATMFEIFSRGGGARPPLERKGVPIVLDVQPLPEEGRPAGDVAVGRYRVKAQLDRDQLATGDAATLTATIRGYGHIQSVRLPSPALEGLQVLAPQTRDLIESPDDHVGGTRIYEWLIVPKVAGAYTLQPFVINTFDTATRRYVQVKSEPIQLTAAGLTVAGATEPVDATPGAEQPDAPQQATEEIAWEPIRNRSELARRADRSGLRRVLPWGLLVPPAAWLLLLATGGLRRLRSRGAMDEREVALREAKKQMATAATAATRGDGAEYHAALANALTRLVEARLGEPVGSDTRPALRKRVTSRGMAGDLADALTSLLARCDEARFSPLDSSTARLQQTHSEAKSVFDGVSAFRPKSEEANG